MGEQFKKRKFPMADLAEAMIYSCDGFNVLRKDLKGVHKQAEYTNYTFTYEGKTYQVGLVSHQELNFDEVNFADEDGMIEAYEVLAREETVVITTYNRIELEGE